MSFWLCKKTVFVLVVQKDSFCTPRPLTSFIGLALFNFVKMSFFASQNEFVCLKMFFFLPQNEFFSPQDDFFLPQNEFFFASKQVLAASN